MKEIYTVHYEVYNPKDGWTTVPQTAWCFSEARVNKEIECKTFSELWDLVESFEGIYRTETLFGRKEIGFYDYGTCYVTEKNFKKKAPYHFRIRYTIYEPTMEWLYKHLSLAELNEYCLDRNIKIQIGG